jgi:nitrogen regulatory protein PII
MTMGTAELTRMQKLEVVVKGEDIPAVRDLFEQAGVTGWTGLSNVSGVGHGGFHQGKLLFNEKAALSMLITVVPDERLAPLVTGLRALLEDRAGVMFITETSVSRPEYFQ